MVGEAAGVKVVMASGLPDYYRGVDIAYQALAQVTNRPKYGGAQSADGYLAVAASQENTLFTISGKGMTYGGYVKVEYASSQKDSGFLIYLDGGLFGTAGFEALNKFGLTLENSHPLYLRKYDDVNFIYCMALSRGITFESSFSLAYLEQHGTTPTVWYHVIYALI